jgi:TonB family protein
LSDAEAPPVAATQRPNGNAVRANDRAGGPATARDVVATEDLATSSTTAAPSAQLEALETDDTPAVLAEDKVVQELESAKKEAPASQGTIPTNAYPSARNYPNTQSVPAGSAKKAPQRKRSAAPAMPQGGWDVFNDYLRRNARLTNAARNNNVSGTVSLQFDVTPEGKAVNIKVLKSLGYGCDEAAEELVRNFNWEPGASPITVDIPFVR